MLAFQDFREFPPPEIIYKLLGVSLMGHNGTSEYWCIGFCCDTGTFCIQMVHLCATVPLLDGCLGAATVELLRDLGSLRGEICILVKCGLCSQ